MANRHKKNVLEAEEDGKLVIRSVYSNLPTVAAGEYAEKLSAYTDEDGNQAVVPPGWTVSGVSKENTIWGKDVSLVIYRIPKEAIGSINWADYYVVERLKKRYSQFVWVPVKFPDHEGTFEGKEFLEKFKKWLLAGKQAKSVKKYGGFYISRYDISKSPEGEPQSVRGAMPWVEIKFHEAKRVAATIEDNGVFKSQLTYDAEYDSVLEWLIKSGCKNHKEVVWDSTQWGNHWNTNDSPRRVVETGEREEWSANNIYDFAGNVDEWTQEPHGRLYRAIRGGNFLYKGYRYAVAHSCYDVLYEQCISTGFRATFYIK